LFRYSVDLDERPSSERAAAVVARIAGAAEHRQPGPISILPLRQPVPQRLVG
jgi:hypothetical protein